MRIRKKIFYKNLIQVFFGLVLFLSGFFGFGVIHTARADFNCATFQKQFQITVGGKTINTIGTLPQYCSLQQVLEEGIKIALGAAGTVAILFIIIGGFWLLTAGGNEEQAEKGRKVLTNSVIGLVVVIMSFAIVTIITNLLSGNIGGGSSSSGTSATDNSSTANSTNQSGSQSSAGQSLQFNGSQTAAANQPYSFSITVPQSTFATYGCPGNPSVFVKISNASGNTQNTYNATPDSSGTATFQTDAPANLGYDPASSKNSMPISLWVCGQVTSFNWNIQVK